jgi:hypothetical protein
MRDAQLHNYHDDTPRSLGDDLWVGFLVALALCGMAASGLFGVFNLMVVA